MSHVRELLPAYALGALEGDEASRVERALAEDPVLAAELDALLEAGADLVAALPPEAPDPAVRARLLASVEGRFARFAARFAQLFDVTLERARDLLAMADVPSAWEAGPGPGSALLHFAAGPRYASADAGFVRLAPGMTFPWHRHHGHEHCLVLAGEAVDSMCGTMRPGDEATADGGTEHEFRTVGDEPYVFAVRVFGVDFDVPRPDPA